MLTQRCKICGERHHRYEPHIFRVEQGRASPAAGSTPQSQSRRNRGTDASKIDNRAQEPEAAETTLPVAPIPDTSDTEPSAQSLVKHCLTAIEMLDDELFVELRNGVMKEYMRRHRKPKR